MITQEKYINPFTDFGFKKLFGEEPNKDILIDFLNELLPEKHKIEDLKYGKNEKLASSPLERKAIFDLYCTSKSGERILIEVQKAKQNYFKDRSLYYSSFLIQEQAQQGVWDFELAAVYTVGILDFVFSDHAKEKEKLFHRVQLKDQNCNVFYEKLTYFYLELPKFKKEAHQLENKFEKWLYIFRHLHKLQERPTELQERVFKKLFKVAEIAKFSNEERKAYEESVKIYRDITNVVNTAKMEGREEGRKEGREEGKKEGIEEIIKAGLKEGASIELLSKLTGLSVQAIQKIKNAEKH